MNGLEAFITGPLVYIALAVFIVVTACKIHGIMAMPRHLRWDLYPVPHQGSEGSKYQKVDFYKAPKHFDFFNELKEMSEEILFIKRAFVSNRKLWYGSYMLHLGFYAGTVWLVLLAAGAAMLLSGMKIGVGGGFTGFVHYATILTGVVSLTLGLAGTAWLYIMRISDPDMQLISDATSYINLGLMFLMFGTGFASWLLADPTFSGLREQVAGILSFSSRPLADNLIAWQIFWFCLFLIYLPFSRMLHFVAKYFFYHNIMWDDEPLKAGSDMEKDIMGYLGYQVEWSAQHIKPGGTWVEQVSARPEKGGDKK